MDPSPPPVTPKPEAIAPERNPELTYEDPLTLIWRVTAQACGLRVARSDAAYAACDGQGTLIIGVDATLDADDHPAQLIFHELCHWACEGPAAAREADWGFTEATPVSREHAALALQAHLARAHRIDHLMRPTTVFADVYDAYRHVALPPAAEAGYARAFAPPFGPHLQRALQASAQIVGAVQSIPAVTGQRSVWHPAR